MRTTFAIACAGALGAVHAQVLEPSPAPLVNDRPYFKEAPFTQRVVPYPHIREADVMWHKRIWRDIDCTERINLPLFYPMEATADRTSLFDAIVANLGPDGAITAYHPGVDGWDDEFRRVLTPLELDDLLRREAVVDVEGLDGEPYKDTVVTTTTSEDIRRYRLKEDWIFDKQRSTMDIRIIGIAPLKANKGEDGEIRGYQPLFWLYFPELRYVLANVESFNPWNDAERRSFDHVFRARRFSSTVVKESNVYDRNIAEYKTGIDGVLEGEGIKQALFEFEHDLWCY